MTTGTAILLALVAVVAAFAGWAARGYLNARGERLIECPETHTPEGVRVDAGHAAMTGLMGRPELRLSDCTRWPENRNCGQDCLSQIQAAPDGCLVRSTVARWYEGKTCVLCHRPVGEREWLEHPPALVDLRDQSRRTRSWQDVPATRIHDALDTHAPICWNCHVTETFRRERPELVIDRPS